MEKLRIDQATSPGVQGPYYYIDDSEDWLISTLILYLVALTQSWSGTECNCLREPKLDDVKSEII